VITGPPVADKSGTLAKHRFLFFDRLVAPTAAAYLIGFLAIFIVIDPLASRGLDASLPIGRIKSRNGHLVFLFLN
jgi:hypothetical protein